VGAARAVGGAGRRLIMPEPDFAPDFVPGDRTGLALPTHPEALLAAGPDWLTEAFRAWGYLKPDEAVTAITASEQCTAGNSGEKRFLTVTYSRQRPGLHTRLFAKFSRYHADAFRDRRKHELASEIDLAALSRLPAFPVRVAAACFGDFHAASGSGLLITERVSIGEQGIEPARPKCMDHELANPGEYYRATLSALARLAAAHHAGRLSPEVDRLFPFDSQAAMADPPVGYGADELPAKLDAIRAFAAGHPQLLPAGPAFLDRFEAEASELFARQDTVRRFLVSDPRLIALTHWNTNIDNAWFWRDEAGTFQCGLLDWGMVRPMNVAFGLWGGLSASDPAMLARELDDLLALYARVLADEGGPELPRELLGRHFDLSVALMLVALMIDVPALVTARVPRLAEATGPHDPLIRADQVAHGFLHVFANALMLWERRDFGASLRAVLAGA